MNICPVSNNINNCSSKEYGLTCDTCYHTNNFNQQKLHNKYITSDKQHVIYNDGSMISWWEVYDVCVEIHQSDLEKDNYVFIDIEDLIDITNLISIHKNLL